jgi:hypothetical protein
MTGTLLAAPVYRAVDQNGVPMAGALLQFYLTGTTTPANVYTSSALSTPLSNPVAADSGGLFPAIYLDPTVVYRCQLLTSASALVKDIDPVTESVVEATQTQVNAGSATGIYVSPAKLAAWSGVAGALGYTPANKAGDTLTNSLLAFTSLATNSSGYLGLPVNEQDAAYTTALSDAGKLVRCNSASGVAYTLPPVSSVAYPVGTAIAFRNVGAGTVTLTPGSGVTVSKAGSASQSTIALAQYAFCTAVMEATNVWVVSGAGMT